MGGAQPLAITMNEGVGLIVEVDAQRARRRQEMGYVDEVVDSLEEAMTQVEDALVHQVPRSIGLVGNAADVYPELVVRGVVPDVVTGLGLAREQLLGGAVRRKVGQTSEFYRS